MRCPSCGQRLADEARRCPVCGTVIDEETRRNASEESAFDTAQAGAGPSNAGQPFGGAQGYQSYQTSAEQNQSPAKPMKMKWYKFLIYFSLILTGISNMYTGVQAVVGMQYETKSQAAQVYAAYPGLHIVDVVYGILLIGFGIFALIVRQYLARFKAKGPKMLLLMYVASLVIEIAYIAAGSLVSGVNLLTASSSGTMLISSIIVSLFMIGANKVYFDKRAHLFKN